MRELSENAHKVLCKRYLLPKGNASICLHCGGQHETPEDMFRRVSFGNEAFYNIMSNLDFLPNSPALFNAGSGQGTLSACFKFDVEDSMDSIMEVATKSAFVQKWGGGVGYCLSALRQKGAPIRSTHGKACGPVAVMDLYQSVTDMITQGGKRHGAQMAILHCNHPDIKEFIHSKDSGVNLSTFNISVACTNDFMQRARTEGESPEAKLLEEMAECAWRTGDPGIYFIDAAEATNPTPHLGKLTGTNPCFIAGTKVCTVEELVLDKDLYAVRNIKQAIWKAIEEIKVGDYVLSLDENYYNETGQVKKGWKKVTATHSTVANGDLYKICFEHAGLIVATESHPIYVVDIGWRKARELCRGDRCLGYNIDKGFGSDTEYIVESVELATSVTLVLEKGRTVVYNLEVEDNNNYYAGGVLVHNCGEVPLLDNEPCNIGSINLSNFVVGDGFDYERLEYLTKIAVRLMDTILDYNKYPNQAITDAAMRTRKLGIGVMGWADALAMLKIPYDSTQALDRADKVMKTIQAAAHYESHLLASEQGCYPGIPDGPGLRNATLTCIAPTGTIAVLAGCSSGIEPHYALENDRAMGDGTILKERVAITDGFMPKTAHEISWEWHIGHQAAFQKYTDLAVSKTINMPESATVENILAAFKFAWQSGCKGITVYRDKSRDIQVLNTEGKAAVPGLHRHMPPERISYTHKFVVSGTEGYLHLGMFEDGSMGEMFVTASKQGATIDGLLNAVAIITSVAIQHGVPLELLAEKMIGNRFEPAGLTANNEIPTASSLLDYIFRYAMKKFGKGGLDSVDSGMLCPNCGAAVILQEGCLLCSAGCGWTRC